MVGTAARTRSLALRVAVGIAAAALVIAIGVSQIYLGMHYPSDVVAGYLAAAVWLATLLVLDRWRLGRRRAKTAGIRESSGTSGRGTRPQL